MVGDSGVDVCCGGIESVLIVCVAYEVWPGDVIVDGRR